MNPLKLYALAATLLIGWLTYHLWQVQIALDHSDEAALAAYEMMVLHTTAPPSVYRPFVEN